MIPGTNNCTYGDIAIGPFGLVMQACNLTETGQGGGKVSSSAWTRTGLGPVGFGDRLFVTATHVGGFDFIPPQPDRSVDAEVGLAWGRTGGPHAGRVSLVYTREQPNESDDIDIYVRQSDDGGAIWSAGLRVNDDRTTNSQFLPKISLDPTTGDPPGHFWPSWPARRLPTTAGPPGAPGYGSTTTGPRARAQALPIAPPSAGAIRRFEVMRGWPLARG